MREYFMAAVIGLLVAYSPVCAGTGQFLMAAWQTSEGLPHNAPTMALQTRDAYLWVATHSGLARFDGVRFETFDAEDGLPDNRVLSLLEDRQGTLWIGTGQGVARRQAGNIEAMDAPWPDIAIWQLAEADDGAIWMGTEDGAIRTLNDSAPKWIPRPDGHSGVRSLLGDGPDGAVWILFRSGLFRWADGTLTENTAFAAMAANRELFSLRRDAAGALWVAGQNLLVRGTPDGAGWEDASAGMRHAEGSHILAQPATNGTLWVATRNRGVHLLRDGQWRHIGVDDGLSHDDVRWITEDREGNLWIATNGGGLNRLAEQRLEVFGRGRGLGRQTTTALVSDPDGVIWAGTDGDGVLRLDEQSFQPALPEGTLPEGFIWSLLAARDGAIWIGTFRHGVMRWKDGRGAWLRLDNGLVSNWIPSLMEDRNGRIWIGTENGGVQILQDKHLITLRGHRGGRGAPVVCMLEDRSGAVWIATGGDGLYLWQDDLFQRFSVPDGLPNAMVNSLHEDDAGRLWIGTSGGLALRANGQFRSWSTQDGLISNAVVQILDDANGNLWIGTDQGLQRLLPEDLLAGPDLRADVSYLARRLAFSRPDGLPSPQFTGGHGSLAIRDAAGNLWFSLASGVVRVDPALVPVEPAVPARVHIESLAAGGRGYWHFERGSAAPVEIPPGAGSIQIRYTSPALRAPENLSFRHRIRGGGEDWLDSGSERIAALGSMPPGIHRFEVVAANPASGWISEPAMIDFIVRPYFWQTAIFRTSAFLAAAAMIGLAMRRWSLRRVRRSMEALQRERHLERERARIARDLHDDLGATLTEVNFLGSLGLAGAQSQGTRDRLEGIVERVQRMAKSLDEIVWTVNPVNDTLFSTANYLCSRVQESLDSAGIRCRLLVAENLPPVELDSERRHHLLMALNEAVNNVMKHSESSQVRFKLEVNSGILHAAIEDEGIGFDPAAVPHGRNGLTNIRRRMEAAGGRGEVTSTPGGGTRVAISLPLFSPHAPPA